MHYETANSVRRDYVLQADPFTAAEYDREYEIEKEVSLPHTWNVDPDPELQEYRGIGSYETTVMLSGMKYCSGVLYIGAAYPGFFQSLSAGEAQGI